MKTHEFPKELTYDLIKKATHGDNKAIEEILKLYDPYISSLCIYEGMDGNGGLRREINEDMKIEIQTKLATAIKKWEAMI